MLFWGKFDQEFFLLHLVLVANALGYPSLTVQAFLSAMFTVWSDDHGLHKLCLSGNALAKASIAP